MITHRKQGGGIEAGAVSGVAGGFGIDLEATAVAAFVRLGELFLEWNARINLASLRNPAELVERHFIDAFAAARFVGGAATVADVGSGGGLPGLPLAILAGTTHFDLFEPNRKKAAFLRTAVRELGMTSRVEVRTTAVESPVEPEVRGTYDVALSRATLAPAKWLSLGRELVRVTGRVLVFATVHSEVGLPPPAEVVAYGENRRLLVYPA
jgi:16S rRNA (guanine527-N7)-methyltransferase